MISVAIADLGSCNLDSTARAVEECGGKPFVTETPLEIAKADRIILPGVGAFSETMKSVKDRDLNGVLADRALGDAVPLLGICVGMQILAKSGEEGGNQPGLGMIDATAKALEPKSPNERIPHIGWNEVHHSSNSPLMEGIPDGADFYFIHSYHVFCNDQDDIAGLTPYCGEFVSVISHGNIFGVQFHPEKSQQWGLRILTNFLTI